MGFLRRWIRYLPLLALRRACMRLLKRNTPNFYNGRAEQLPRAAVSVAASPAQVELSGRHLHPLGISDIIFQLLTFDLILQHTTISSAFGSIANCVALQPIDRNFSRFSEPSAENLLPRDGLLSDMTGKGKSRWAESEEDAARAAALKKEKELKRRLKKEKEAAAAAAARKLQDSQGDTKGKGRETNAPTAGRYVDDDDDDGSERPAKRRRLTPEPAAPGEKEGVPGNIKLLRFQGGGFGRSRSVENYDKLNDIEEGAYGWVARAKEIATGRVVALKRLKIEPNDRNGLPVTGLREIQILKDCEHRNIVEMKEVVVGEDTTKIEK